MKKTIAFIILSSSCMYSCTENEPITVGYKTQNIVIIIMDGARYSETLGDSFRTYIPKIDEISNLGVVNTNFFNEGITSTTSGHTAITTGTYQEINNGGLEYPQNASLFQHWMAAKNKGANKAWIISSKDKLQVLSDCIDPVWNKKFTPSSDCGVNGLGSGYRKDDITFSKVMEILPAHHPQLVLINFREPDYSGHSGNWDNYLNGITLKLIHIIKEKQRFLLPMIMTDIWIT